MALSKISLKYPSRDLKLGVVLEDYKRSINKIIDEINGLGGGSSGNVFTSLDDNYFAQGTKIYIRHSYSAGTGLTGGGTLGASRTFSLSHLGLESLADPGADRIFFWDDSEDASKWLACDGVTIGITGTTLAIIPSGLNMIICNNNEVVCHNDNVVFN